MGSATAGVSWLPDGRGLPDEARESIAEHDQWVHLRLTSPDGRFARGACDRSLGEWWSGVAGDVTCPACLELVHA
jgi:hypothetical protein